METTTQKDLDLYHFTLQWADTSLILGHRLSEWCGHGPVLEQDIAMANIALDFIGEARSLYQYAAEQEGAGRTEDDLAYFRNELQYRNCLLVEQPNGDFGKTILRQFLYEAFHVPWLEEMTKHPDAVFSGVAAKSLKEAQYHYQWSAEWVIRLGDGTEESKRRMEDAVGDLWTYSGELMLPAAHEQALISAGRLPAYDTARARWEKSVQDVFNEATLDVPALDAWMQTGGKEGRHTESLGYLLAEMQVVQRAHPGNKW